MRKMFDNYAPYAVGVNVYKFLSKKANAPETVNW